MNLSPGVRNGSRMEKGPGSLRGLLSFTPRRSGRRLHVDDLRRGLGRGRARCGGWCGSLSAALQDATLEVGPDVDRELFGGDVAVDIGGGDQLDLLARDGAHDAAPDLDIVARDIALDGAGLADDQPADAHVALDGAVDLEIAAARDIALELEVRGRVAGRGRRAGAGAAARAGGAGPAGDGRSGSGGMDEPLSAREGWDGAGDLVLLNKLVSGSHEAGGVLRAAVHPHFVMQMHAGGASCGSHGADALTDADALAGKDSGGVQVGVSRLETATMIYLNGVAIP